MSRRLISKLDTLSGGLVFPIVEALYRTWRMRKYNMHCRERQRRYGHIGKSASSPLSAVRELREQGCSIVRNAIPKEWIPELRSQMEAHLDAGTCLNRSSKDSARALGDRASAFLTSEEIKQGQEYLRCHTNYVSIEDPLIFCPASVSFAFYDLIIDLARDYLGALPYLAGINLRKSYRNHLPEFDTLNFHSDPDSPKFLKFFFYLNDVGEEDGPFCFVKGTVRKKHSGWMKKYHWTYDEMKKLYRESNITLLTANEGDMIIADTNGFHRGTKVTRNDRCMLTVDYCVYKDGNFPAKKFKISKSALERMSEKQRICAEDLDVV